jgi:maltooligosyltrehalose trehalohydrolase
MKAKLADQADKPGTIGFVRRLPVGAEVQPGGGVHFRVWAPRRKGVAAVIEPDPGASSGSPAIVPLAPDRDGYYAGLAADLEAGALYRYLLDGEESFPDPASRHQPFGPHGPSRVVDPATFAWSDRGWGGLELPGQVFYELHIGTFTPEGTWSAAARRLPGLIELGVTAIEVMPVAEFPGAFGWGYDGVDLFAPYHNYGSPDDMRRFVDRAHALGLGVILDVVYNHLGPDGAYHRSFSEGYFHGNRSGNEWGDALNFDGAGCAQVREFFAANAAYWIDEFRLDGLRLDATQAIRDDSRDHIIAAIAARARAAAGDRAILIVAENEPQDSALVRPIAEGGMGLDALWNDDFHHASVVALTGRSEAYYSDFAGSPQELISAARWGFLFQGQFSRWQQKPRGFPASGIDPARLITFLENHDQVANSARGERLLSQTAPGRYRALAALWLLSPQTPMFFQGQEYGSTRPFLYFADHSEELAGLVHRGRADFLSQFRSLNDPEIVAAMADPDSRGSFLSSKLDIEEHAESNPLFAFHRDLLKLRRTDPAFRARRSDWIHGAVLGPEALALRFLADGNESRLLLVNLGRDLYPAPAAEPMLAPPPGAEWSPIWHSERPSYGGGGLAPLHAGASWRLPGHIAVLLAPILAHPKFTEGENKPLEIQDVHPEILAHAQPDAGGNPGPQSSLTDEGSRSS